MSAPAQESPSVAPLDARLAIGFRAIQGQGMFAVLAASLAANVLALGLPIVTLQIYDRVIPAAGLDTLTILIVGMVAVIVMDAVIRAARARVSAWTGAQAELRLSSASFERVLKAPLATTQSVSPGVQLDRLNAVDSVRDFYASQGPTLLVDAPFAVVFLLLIALIGGPLVLVPLVLLALFVGAAYHVGGRLRERVAARGRIDDRRYSFLLEALAGIHSIKAMAAEPLMARRYERLGDASAQAAYETSLWSGLSQAIGQAFFTLSTSGILVFGAFLVVEQRLTVGALAACTLLGGRALQPLLRIMSIWTQFQSIRLGQERLAAIAAIPAERAEGLPAMPPLRGALRLEDVDFAYPGRPALFDRLSLDVEAGACIAITGINSSGKSSLLRIIQGVQPVRSGVVAFDGVDIATREVESLRRQIAYLPQRPQVFRGTIMENLTMFRDGPAVREAMSIAEQLGLDKVVGRMPSGYDTEISDSPGDILAGGVRQRIAIVRALMGDPRVFLFDEANLALDGPSDTLLRDYLARQKGRRTMILVSFRPSLLRLADKVYRIDARRLVAITDGARGPESRAEPTPPATNAPDTGRAVPARVA